MPYNELDYDEEVPRGFSDADIEQANFEAIGRRLSRLHKRGICAHGHVQGPPGKPVITCLGCGATFTSDAEWHAEHRRIVHGD